MALVTPLRDQYEHACQELIEFSENELGLYSHLVLRLKDLLSSEDPDLTKISKLLHTFISVEDVDSSYSSEVRSFIEFLSQIREELHQLEMTEFGKL